MTLPLVCAFIWLILANVIAMFPSRDHHWRAAYALIAVGIPILGWVTYVNGPVWGLLCLAAGTSVLRWPVIYFARDLRRRVVKQEPAE